jgi:hypothetical protein
MGQRKLDDVHNLDVVFGQYAADTVEGHTDWLTNSVAPGPAGSSSLYSQGPAAGPYPEPTGSNLHSSSQSP